MTTPYTPVPTHHSTITCLTDDDAWAAASYNRPIQELADETASLRATLSRQSYAFKSGGYVYMQADTEALLGDLYSMNGAGVFELDLQDAVTNAPWIYSSAISGRHWTNTVLELVRPGVAQGLARIGPLDGDGTPAGKLPLSYMRNMIMSTFPVTCVTAIDTTVSWSQTFSIYDIGSVIAGDVLSGVVGNISLTTGASSTGGPAVSLQLIEQYGTSPTTYTLVTPVNLPYGTDAKQVTVTMPFAHTVLASGRAYLVLQCGVGASSGVAVKASGILGFVTRMRP
jgi:hypothetical protein